MRTHSERRDIGLALDEVLSELATPEFKEEIWKGPHPVDLLDQALARRGWSIRGNGSTAEARPHILPDPDPEPDEDEADPSFYGFSEEIVIEPDRDE